MGAALWAFAITWRWEKPALFDGWLLAAVAILLLALLGVARSLSSGTFDWRWVAVGAFMSIVGVFIGVPENVSATVAFGLVAGLTVTAVLTGASLGPSAGAALVALVGWVAIAGAVGRPWSTLGGAMCVGLAPWLALRGALPSDGWGLRPGWWLLVVHAGLVLAAARWVGSAADASWTRLAVIAGAGAVTAVVVRWSN